MDEETRRILIGAHNRIEEIRAFVRGRPHLADLIPLLTQFPDPAAAIRVLLERHPDGQPAD